MVPGPPAGPPPCLDLSGGGGHAHAVAGRGLERSALTPPTLVLLALLMAFHCSPPVPGEGRPGIATFVSSTSVVPSDCDVQAPCKVNPASAGRAALANLRS